MIKTTARGILLDIEGTTSSISFVYDVMFPFVRTHVDEFLKSNWSDEAVKQSVAMLAVDLGKENAEQWIGGLANHEQQAEVVKGVISLTDADVKATGLKQLQGLIWKDGFHNGQLVAHLYDEVADCIGAWNAAGLDVRIYSSGSIQAQKLFFGYTVAGNLLNQFNGHYDTTTGLKQEASSYEAIAGEYACEASEIVFVSDVIAELEAAKKAGLQTVLSIRPGNKPVAPNHGFDSITSFRELQISAT